MVVTLSGVRLEDPKLLRDDLLRQGRPVGEWGRKCNSFTSPVEREPGVGHVLIRKADWDRISDQASLTLAFTDRRNRKVEFVKLHPVSQPTPLSQEVGARNPVLWLTLADRRAKFMLVAAGGAFNLRSADGGWDADTLNSGTPYTWAEIVADLWGKLKAVFTDLPSTAPTFPATPAGTPESIYGYSKDAWTVLCTAVQAAGYLVKYDPTADSVSIIDPASSAPVEPPTTQASRVWDTASGLSIIQSVPRPAAVRVAYHRIGRQDMHVESATLSESGTLTGGALTLPAYPAAAGNPVSNTTYLAAFAGRVRDWWRRDLAAASEPRSAQYRGWQEWCRSAVGHSGYAAWAVSQLAGDEVQTAVTSGPLMRLDPGDPVPDIVSSSPNSYLLDVPCLVFDSEGNAIGLAGVVVDGDGTSAECVVKGDCGCSDNPSPPVPPPPPTTATVQGYVNDTASNAINNVVLQLVQSTTTLNATTDTNGYYSFSSVPTGSLVVTITEPSGYAVNRWDLYGAASGSGTDTTAEWTAVASGYLLNWVLDQLGTVAGTVSNADLTSGLSGRTVMVLDVNTDAHTTTTDMSGNYSFTDIPHGSALAYVVIDPPTEDAEHNLNSGGWTAGNADTITVSGTATDLDFRIGPDGVPFPSVGSPPAPPVPPPPP